MQELKGSQSPLQDSITKYSIKQNELKQKLELIVAGETKYALYRSTGQLQQQITSMQLKYDGLVGELQRTHPEDIKEIQADLKAVKQQAIELNARMSAVGNNLLLVLTKNFDESQIQIVAKLINRDLLSSMPLGEEGVVVLDKKQFFEYIDKVLSLCKNGFYDDGRVHIDLKKLQQINIDDYFNYETIRKNLARLEKRRCGLKRDLEVVLDYKGKEKTKNELLDKIKEEERNLLDFKVFIELKAEKAECEKALKDITVDLDADKDKLNGITDALFDLGKEEQALQGNKVKKKTVLESLKSKYAQVIPISSSEPVGIAPEHRLPFTLDEMIDTYLLSLAERRSSSEQINQSLNFIEAKNGLRFTSGKDEDTTIRELLEAVEGKEAYIKQKENCQKAVSQEIGALLKGLTDRFNTFTHEIKQFNRKMNKNKISNINRIQFVVDDSNDILRAVKKIVEQGSIFSNPESVHRAVKHLDELITKKNVKLSLENLFNMGIKVELEDGKVSSSFNEANIQSTGTGLTVKVILNVMLLNRLLYTKPGQIVNIPIYIDEAGQIDPANQQTLIDQCLPSGFVPVFASVDAQATADYWIGLHEVGGRIYVDQEDWFRLSKLDEELVENVNA